jgi:hypothetical protein
MQTSLPRGAASYRNKGGATTKVAAGNETAQYLEHRGNPILNRPTLNEELYVYVPHTLTLNETGSVV